MNGEVCGIQVKFYSENCQFKSLGLSLTMPNIIKILIFGICKLTKEKSYELRFSSPVRTQLNITIIHRKSLSLAKLENLLDKKLGNPFFQVKRRYKTV